MKMNKKLIALFLIISVLVLSMTLFACNNVENDPGENKVVYQIPDGLTINVAIYDGIELLGTAVNASFANIEQHKLRMDTINSHGTETSVVYIAYKLTDIVTALNITLPEINGVFAVASDNYTIEAENIDRAYITIGTEVDGAFVADADSPRYIADNLSTDSKLINKKIAKVVINDPLTTVNVNVELYDNDTHLGTITNNTLEKVARQTITMTTVNSKGNETTVTYLGYKLSDIAAKLRDVTLPTITNVRSLTSDDRVVDADNIDNAYITIGKIVDGDFVADADAPRYLSDSTSTESKSVNKHLVKIVFNYVG